MCEDFDRLVELNRKYLEGDIETTPCHCGPIDDETAPLVDDLLKLHEFKLLTIGSQPLENKECFWDETRNEWADYQQRPLLSFIMK